MSLIKCSAKAMLACPDAKTCCTQRYPGEFAVGSECHRFNEEVESLFTNADHIRSMSDEELMELFYRGVDIMFCTNKPECIELLHTEDGVPEGMCKECAMEWLKQPHKENIDEN